MTTDPAATCPPGWNTSTFFQSATPETIRACVSAGENVNSRSPDGRTPLHFAATNTDDPSVIRALLGAGARPGANVGGAARCVAREADATAMSILIEAGADLAGVLHLSILNRTTRVTEIVIVAGADLNEPMTLELQEGTTEGNTPLHFAARAPADQVNLEAAELLLVAGADPNRPDSSGRTPLDWAEARGQTSLAALLRGYGGKPGG